MNKVHGFDFSKTVMGALDIEIIEFTPEQVVASMPITWKCHNPYGILHGGVSVVIAETVASAGSYLFIDSEKQAAVGLDINANHVKSAASGMVRAVGKPAHVGKTTQVWDIRIYDEQDDLLCISRCTMSILDKSNPGEYIK